MKRVGLTGGMGSGKTTVAQMFQDLGVPVYNSDENAKRIMRTSKVARRKIIALLGKESYRDDSLNRAFIANKVFKDPEVLAQLNRIVHPLVRKSFLAWSRRQVHPFVIQEAAIIFENGNHDFYDYIILVTAPMEIRISRILDRDGHSREKILERMDNQWPDSKKIPLSDFVLPNTDISRTRSKARAIYRQILENS
ncbi:MAG: dephospho-CoA kinase [Bacteroidota bacterium]